MKALIYQGPGKRAESMYRSDFEARTREVLE